MDESQPTTAPPDTAATFEIVPVDKSRPTFGQWCTLIGSLVQLAALAYLVVVLR